IVYHRSGRFSPGCRRGGRAFAPGGPLLLAPGHMETAAQAGRVRRSDGQEAWPQVGCHSAGEGEPRTAGCKCPLDEEAEERRVDHRGSKKSGCVVGQPDSEHPDRRGELMSAPLQLSQSVGQAVACRALCVPRATLYRHMQPAAPRQARPTPERALDAAERQAVLDHLHSERFRDKAPVEVYATLLDENIYLCSIRTMHRILAQNGELKERRNQPRHPQYTKPELLATRPNEIWSWDITKLLGPAKWTYFHLYVILDIFSRNVVGWMVARRETAELAKRLIAATCEKQGIAPDTLTIHADRGTSMTSKPVALMLADLGVTKTHSRPHVSDSLTRSDLLGSRNVALSLLGNEIYDPDELVLLGLCQEPPAAIRATACFGPHVPHL